MDRVRPPLVPVDGNDTGNFNRTPAAGAWAFSTLTAVSNEPAGSGNNHGDLSRLFLSLAPAPPQNPSASTQTPDRTSAAPPHQYAVRRVRISKRRSGSRRSSGQAALASARHVLVSCGEPEETARTGRSEWIFPSRSRTQRNQGSSLISNSPKWTILLMPRKGRYANSLRPLCRLGDRAAG